MFIVNNIAAFITWIQTGYNPLDFGSVDIITWGWMMNTYIHNQNMVESIIMVLVLVAFVVLVMLVGALVAVCLFGNDSDVEVEES